MSAFRLRILSDGRAGHVSTSRGIAELVAGRLPCQIDILPIRLRAKFLRPLLRFLVNSGLACRLAEHFGPDWPKAFYRDYRVAPADAVISTGGDTIYLNAYEGRCLGRVNFFCGSPRGVHTGLFDLIVHTRQARLPNWQAMEVLPSWVRGDRIAESAAAFAADRLGGQDHGYWAVLIGGDGNGYRFRPEDITALLDGIAGLARREGKRLLLTTSRRTGRPVETAIRRWQEAHPAAPVAYRVLYNLKPERVAGVFMKLADAVFCTEDSTSMISEAVLSRRPVLALASAAARPVRDQRAFLEQLAANGRIIRLGIHQLIGLDMKVALGAWRPYEGEDHRHLQALMLDKLAPAMTRTLSQEQP